MHTKTLAIRPAVVGKLQRIHNLQNANQVAALLKLTPTELNDYVKGRRQPSLYLVATIIDLGLGADEVLQVVGISGSKAA